VKTLIPCAFAVLLITGCYKYDDTAAAARLQIPPYTETGANTFGCLEDGTVWANFGAVVFHRAESIGGEEVDSSKVISQIERPFTPGADTIFYVRATYSLVKKGKELRDENMSIQIPKNGSLVGTHLLTDSIRVFQYSTVFYNQYSSKARNPFMVIITKDSLVNGFSHIVSGRFYGVLYNFAQTDSVTISGGVFDTKTQN
jgi:hypothetical protein